MKFIRCLIVLSLTFSCSHHSAKRMPANAFEASEKGRPDISCSSKKNAFELTASISAVNLRNDLLTVQGFTVGKKIFELTNTWDNLTAYFGPALYLVDKEVETEFDQYFFELNFVTKKANFRHPKYLKGIVVKDMNCKFTYP